MLKIYNTLTQKKEVFQPITPGRVSLYVCGVTVYDYCHLGHARTYLAIDIIVRYLCFQGYTVNYVRNITDIDDKILNRAQTTSQPWQDIAAQYTQAMQEDFAALNLIPPQYEPRATQYISHMVCLIEKIIQRGYAYVTAEGDVYFSIQKDPQYGDLSHALHRTGYTQSQDHSRVSPSQQKQCAQDFALWKAAKPEESAAWPSPWGKGRPGWHIECSAMSMQLLGQSFDLHGGGRDLIFPHHENERAQSQAVTQQPIVNIWMHTGYLEMNAAKMSKSSNNFIMIREVLHQYPSEVVRYFILSSHYRSPLTYSKKALDQSWAALIRLYTALNALDSTAQPLQDSLFEKQFMAAMNDDFNTPKALTILFELAHTIHRLKEKDPETAAQHSALLHYLGKIFHLLQADPKHFLQQASSVTLMDTQHILALIQARNQARAKQDWSTADRIRDELTALSVMIEDHPQGTHWKIMK